MLASFCTRFGDAQSFTFCLHGGGLILGDGGACWPRFPVYCDFGTSVHVLNVNIPRYTVIKRHTNIIASYSIWDT